VSSASRLIQADPSGDEWLLADGPRTARIREIEGVICPMVEIRKMKIKKKKKRKSEKRR